MRTEEPTNFTCPLAVDEYQGRTGGFCNGVWTKARLIDVTNAGDRYYHGKCPVHGYFHWNGRWHLGTACR